MPAIRLVEMGIEPRLPERGARLQCTFRPEENAKMEILTTLPSFRKEELLAITHRKANLGAKDSFAVQALFRFVTELF